MDSTWTGEQEARIRMFESVATRHTAIFTRDKARMLESTVHDMVRCSHKLEEKFRAGKHCSHAESHDSRGGLFYTTWRSLHAQVLFDRNQSLDKHLTYSWKIRFLL